MESNVVHSARTDAITPAAIPYGWYTDSAQLQRELSLFSSGWHYVGMIEGLVLNADGPLQIPVQAGNVEVIISVDADGKRRGFLNSCLHRGSKLLDAPASKRSIQCPYHAWTYGLDGSLKAAPRVDRESLDECRGELSLREVQVDSIGPLVFIGLGDHPNFAEWSIPIVDALKIADIDIQAFKFHSRCESTCAANWKSVCENYLECYHCQVAHPGLSSILDVRPSEYVQETNGHVASQYAKATHEDDAGGAFWFVWPNLVINVLPGIPNISVGAIIPTDVGNTWRFLDYAFFPDADATAVGGMLEWDDQVGIEDVALVERMQRGMGSRNPADFPHVLSDSEQLVAWFQQQLMTALN